MSPLLPAPPVPDWLERMIPFERSLVQVGAHRMHVMRSGPADAPGVLLLHGNPTWSVLWRKVAHALRDQPLRLVMPDLVGLGLSDKPREAKVHTLDFHAAQVAGLLDALELKRVLLVGQDWGGPIGTLALSLRPGTLSGLVLMNTAIAPPKSGFRQTTFHRFARLPIVSDLAFRLGGLPQSMLHRAQGDPASISGDVARAYRWPLRHWADRAAPLALARMVPDRESHPSVEGLRRAEAFVLGFAGPAALVWGDQDPILGRARRRLEQLLPRAPVTATKAGHFLQEEVPGEIAAAITSVAAPSLPQAASPR